MNKKLLAIAVSSALAAPMAAQAIDYKISGHVNRMIRFADDGVSSDVQHIDNSASRTRFRFVGSGDVGNGMKAGINIETSVGSNNGSQPKQGDGGDTRFDIRHSVLWFSGNWGKVYVGHTSTATDGVMFSDVSGTGLVDEISTSVDYNGGINFRTSGTAKAQGPSIGGVFASFDGGRRDILRYDTPALGPVKLKVSTGQNEYYDIGASLNHDFGAASLAMSAGWSHNGNGGHDMLPGASTFSGANVAANGEASTKGYDNEQFGVSAGLKFSQGTSINLAYGTGDSELDGVPTVSGDGDIFFAKLGHMWGNHRVSVSYVQVDQEASQPIGGIQTHSDSDLTVWGAGWVYNMPKPGIEVYAGYHNWSLDQSATAAGVTVNTDYEDIDVFAIGSRIKFK